MNVTYFWQVGPNCQLLHLDEAVLDGDDFLLLLVNPGEGGHVGRLTSGNSHASQLGVESSCVDIKTFNRNN